jgi:hypothetical protein
MPTNGSMEETERLLEDNKSVWKIRLGTHI